MTLVARDNTCYLRQSPVSMMRWRQSGALSVARVARVCTRNVAQASKEVEGDNSSSKLCKTDLELMSGR